jgi:hypothetical protein
MFDPKFTGSSAITEVNKARATRKRMLDQGYRSFGEDGVSELSTLLKAFIERASKN